MNNSIAAKEYFEDVFVSYTMPDIEKLLDNDMPPGPILITIMSGIDTMGGLIYGFSEGSKKRSIDFMKDYMDIDEKVTKLLYVYVRCGIAHECITISGVFIGSAQPDYKDNDQIFFKEIINNEKVIGIETRALAKLFLESIKKLKSENNLDDLIKHTPSVQDNVRDVFNNAYPLLPNPGSIDRFKKIVSKKEGDSYNSGPKSGSSDVTGGSGRQ